ncbi:hypothetical protein [Veillonella rodentium]|uniref:hypothetical protein n=1 Tax=Veillonella rodentium TaxID=248315 RepID=UPI0014760169|nr:hypothetical protein [Veillonella rodentium]
MARCSVGDLLGDGHFHFTGVIIEGGEHKLLEDLKPIIANLEERIYGMRDSL